MLSPTLAATARDTLRCGVTIGRCEMLDQAMVSIMNKYYLRADSPPESQDKWTEATTLLYEGMTNFTFGALSSAIYLCKS